MKRATLEERIANAKVERVQNALDAVSDWSLRFARNIPHDTPVEERIREALNGLQAVLRDRMPLAGVKPVRQPQEEIRHLTFVACGVIDAIGILMAAETPPASKGPIHERRPQRSDSADRRA